jgi:hypothetical protein
MFEKYNYINKANIVLICKKTNNFRVNLNNYGRILILKFSALRHILRY